MTNFLTTAEAAKILDVNRTQVTRWAKDGTLVPIHKLPTRLGAFLFDPDHVAKLAAERAIKAAERAERLARLSGMA